MNSADLAASLKKHPVVVVSVALCLVFGGLIYFRSGTIAEKQQELETKSAQAAKILNNVRNSANLAEQVAEMQALSKEMESRLMRASQLAINQQYFYKLESENEVKLMDMRQGGLPRNAKTTYVGVPYTVSVQGSYSQVMGFLQRLEAGRHFCRFLTANLNKSAGSSEGSAKANAVMTLTLNLELLGQP
ncbi:MAG: hypothetical protein JNG83_13525 [Opitutaceae bacterium]|nr:hypothetical protein [Opitutaceae bacterium]